MNEVVQKRPTHLFQPGKSGNPNGRPKGSRNKITVMKLALEGELREQLKYDMAAIMAIAINMAKNGDTSMIKLLIDKTVPTTKSVDDEPQKEKITIQIGRLPDGRDEPTIINGEVTKDE